MKLPVQTYTYPGFIEYESCTYLSIASLRVPLGNIWASIALVNCGLKKLLTKMNGDCHKARRAKDKVIREVAQQAYYMFVLLCTVCCV